MLGILFHLLRLWYLILFLATVCLITDITLSSTRDFRDNAVISSFPIPLLADVCTVLIFAYGLWGKPQPFLLPTSSPTSNKCTRFTRHVGTTLLIGLWIMNTTIYASAKIMLRKVMAGVSTLIAILVFVEMIGSIRIGREQRRILKQEKRCLESAKIQENNNSNDSNTTVDGNGQDHSSGIISARGGESCERLIEKDSEGGVMVEIIRPEEVDPAMVIYDQRIMHELCQQQQQYRQQYQHYLEWMTVSALTSIVNTMIYCSSPPSNLRFQ